MKTIAHPPVRSSTALLSVIVPVALMDGINELRKAEGLTISEWMLKDPRIRKWARAHDVQMPKRSRKPISRDAARWLELTEDDWRQGDTYIANLLGVSRQAVANKRRRLGYA